MMISLLNVFPEEFRQRFRAELFPLIVLCLLTVLFFTPRFFGKSFSSVGQHMFYSFPWSGVTTANYGVSMRGHTQTDHAETYYPLTVFATDAWRSGEIPMWMPYGFGGFPIMELGMTSLLYPPRLILLLFFDPIRQHELMMFGHLLMAALGMYSLMRCWGANPAGSVMAAVVWQFNGHNLFWLVIEQMAIVAAWCPWMLLAATLAVRRRSFKWAVVAGIALAMALYSGGTHYAHLSGWLLAAWYGTATLRELFKAFRQRRHRDLIVYLALPVVSLVTLMVVGMAYWLPLLGMLADISRDPVPLNWILVQSANWAKFLQALWLPRSALEVAAPPDNLSFLFTGLIPLALALAGALLNRSVHVRLALLFLAMAFLAIFGVHWWVGFLYRYVPFFNTMKLYVAPYISGLAIAVLAGFGLSELAGRWALRSVIAKLWAVLIVAVGALQTGALLWAYSKLFRGKLPMLAATLLGWRSVLMLLAVVAILVLATVIAARGDKLRNLTWPSYAACVVAAGNLFLFAWVTIPYQWASPMWFYPETPLITALRQNESGRRVMPVYHNSKTWIPPMFAGKTAAIFGIHSANGYESLLPLRTAVLWRAVEKPEVSATVASLKAKIPLAYRPYYLHDQLPISLLEKLSVGLLATPPRTEPMESVTGNNLVANGTLRPIYQGADGIVYENQRALPRAFLVPRIQQAADREGAFQALINPEFNARQAAIFEAPLSSQEAAVLSVNDTATGSARIASESLNRVEIETASSSGQVLVLNDSWASGWKVSVDGVEQTVHRVNFNSRGVVLPAGNHRVVFNYRPMLLLAGLWVSGLTLCALLVWLIGWPIIRRGLMTAKVS